jgi:hypothetical protein
MLTAIFIFPRKIIHEGRYRAASLLRFAMCAGIFGQQVMTFYFDGCAASRSALLLT